jgi:hypothetical protein
MFYSETMMIENQETKYLQDRLCSVKTLNMLGLKSSLAIKLRSMEHVAPFVDDWPSKAMGDHHC